ncbi:MAG: cation:proton antiporter [Lentisphaeraceae bacterium]|nr:cation:proton antiporter [Lentisphaeraceae bacterium]
MQDFGILLILGIGVFGGILGAALFQKLKFPQVVGYIFIGILIGQSGLKLISTQNFDQFSAINDFALGVIGFLVGAELKIPSFKQYGKQFSTILISEGILTFVLVSTTCTLFLEIFLQDWSHALAAGIIFGAIASATDPASTVGVFWQHRAKGALTTTVIAIVALDDALAMALYGAGTAAAKILVSSENGTGNETLAMFLSIIGALATGLGFALLLNTLIQRMAKDKRLVLTVGILLLTIGITRKFNLDIILGTMILGFVLVNKSPRRSEEVFATFKIFASSIYVIFGILIGARIDFASMPFWVWGAVLLYVMSRSIGKIYGSKLGAKIAGADKAVADYTGQCLLTQGGIAAGLAIIASEHLNHITIDQDLHLGDVIVFGITTSTILVQFIGQSLIKSAIFKSKENDKNVTEEDVISEWHVKDVVQTTEPVNEALPLSAVMERFMHDNFLSLPVVNKENKIVGIIRLDDMKELLTDQDSWMWILTADVMKPVTDTFYLDTLLEDALITMKNVNIDQAPILTSTQDETLAGIITLSYTNICVSRELLKRQGEVARN